MAWPEETAAGGLSDRTAFMERSVQFPDTIFLLGAGPESISCGLRRSDEGRRLSLGSILAATPPRWVRVGAFRIQRDRVTNGDYLAFLNSRADGDVLGFEDPRLWQHVWRDLGYRLDTVAVPIDRDGTIEIAQESYAGVRGFVDARILLLRYEAERLLRLPPPAGEDREALTRTSRSLPGIIGWILHGLRRSIVLPGDPERGLFRRDEARGKGEIPRERVSEALDDLVQILGNRTLGLGADPRLEALFRREERGVESITLLSRIRDALRASAGDEIPLASVLYPRSWPVPASPDGGSDLRRKDVPWAERPVAGVSLYEAAAFTVWASSITGLDVVLPSEAELERASSWPRDAGVVGAGVTEVAVDPVWKSLLPWEGPDAQDFHAYFGREERLVEQFLLDRKLYREIADATARVVGDDRLLLLEGFGWQWTRDRLDAGEWKYARFDDPDYPRVTSPVARLSDGRAAPVFDYQVQSAAKHSQFVVKGSPDVVGGPGLTVRRYGLDPLRGHPSTGFRWAILTP